MFLVYGFWVGFRPRSWFAILGPIGWPLFLFVARLLRSVPAIFFIGSMRERMSCVRMATFWSAPYLFLMQIDLAPEAYSRYSEV
jgi:hypothetical protein